MAIASLCICIGALVPWKSLLLHLNFSTHLDARLALIEEITSGTRYRDASWPATLSGFDDISDGGLVAVERTEDAVAALFLVHSGMLGRFIGFMYRSDGSFPGAADLGGEYVAIERWSWSEWFLVHSLDFSSPGHRIR